MQRNVSGQYIELYVVDASTGLPKTGDAANLTFYVTIDGGTLTALTDTSATEISSSNAPGSYRCDLTQAETNGHDLYFTGKSSTSNVRVVPMRVVTTPANFSSQSIDSNGRLDVIKIAGTTQTARDLGASVLLSPGTGTGQLSISAGMLAWNAAWDAEVQSECADALTAYSAATAANVAAVETDTQDIQSRLPAALGANGNIKADLRDMIGDAQSVVDLKDFADDGYDPSMHSVVATGFVGLINPDGIAAASLSTAAVSKIQSGLSTLTQTQVTGGAYSIQSSSCVLGDARIANLDAAVSSRGTSTLTQTQVTGGAYALNSSSFAFHSSLDFTTTQKAATLARVALVDTTTTNTDMITAAGIRTAVGLASANLDTQLDALPTAVENADALLGRNVAGGSSTGRTVKQALYALRNKVVVSGTSLVVFETDDTTQSWTATLTLDAAADPIVSVDPG